MPKTETRAVAAHFALPVAEKPDSQDICFVPNGSYARVVEKLRPEAALPGDVVDLGGRVLGEHQGIVNFTVGQRRGIGLGGGNAAAGAAGSEDRKSHTSELQSLMRHSYAVLCLKKQTN